MRFKDFDYYLPPELIAQAPTGRRDASRLMILDRERETIDEGIFARIPELFRSGDLLVINDTRVIPARLFGEKETGGRVEVFLLRREAGPDEAWSCLIRASKKPRPGTVIRLPAGMTARVLARKDEEAWLVSFFPTEGFNDWLEEQGSMPLPPYIRRPAAAEDDTRYQTVFARASGAVAAPTAGLHFTEGLLREVRARGVDLASLTLHVGLGTFLPVRVEKVSDHRMHRECYSIPVETATAVAACKARKGRVIALGTTTTRALEHAARADGAVHAGDGEADIFIHSDYRFKVVDALITNFHLPCSTLLLLVSAFAGKEFLFRAYREAIRRRFRFFSYGDAMFIR
ncbi:MAG TPA: tRNA preQ1(34) S-adenosylmethionine ribosyltransferase-isomerase QueA [Geobacteraceae bacterium]|nr:tRNA preQ1(34) S-adenosylmethionine ribosyltransferase-isomerase QueA [Geobacteraceae bacterium]